MADKPQPAAQRVRQSHPTKSAPTNALDQSQPFTPARRFVGQIWKRNAGYAIAFLTLIFAVVEINQMSENTKNLGYEFVVGDGTITWGKLKPMGPKAAAYKQFILTVVRVRLQMTPSGLKYPDEAASIFVGDARKTLDKEMPSWLARAGRQNLFSDPYLAKIEDLGDVSGHPLFRLTGVVRLTGVAGVGGMPIIEEMPFYMSLEIAPNPKINLDESADSPFVVLRYQLLLGKAQINRAQQQQQSHQ